MAINTTPEDIIGQDDANGYLTQGVFERGMDAIINAIAKGIGKLPTLDTALNKDRTDNPISNSAVATAIGDTTKLPSPTKGICENVSDLNQKISKAKPETNLLSLADGITSNDIGNCTYTIFSDYCIVNLADVSSNTNNLITNNLPLCKNRQNITVKNGAIIYIDGNSNELRTSNILNNIYAQIIYPIA